MIRAICPNPSAIIRNIELFFFVTSPISDLECSDTALYWPNCQLFSNTVIRNIVNPVELTLHVSLSDANGGPFAGSSAGSFTGIFEYSY